MHNIGARVQNTLTLRIQNLAIFMRESSTQLESNAWGTKSRYEVETRFKTE